MDQSKEMAKLAYAALSEKKGGDIKIIDIHEVSVMADYFIIADGSNLNQVQAMEDRLFYDLERIWRDGKTFVDVNEL